MAACGVTGQFTAEDSVSLDQASLTVTALLLEAGGAGELVRGAGGASLVPLTLVARAGATPTAAIYQTESGGTAHRAGGGEESRCGRRHHGIRAHGGPRHDPDATGGLLGGRRHQPADAVQVERRRRDTGARPHGPVAFASALSSGPRDGSARGQAPTIVATLTVLQRRYERLKKALVHRRSHRVETCADRPGTGIRDRATGGFRCRAGSTRERSGGGFRSSREGTSAATSRCSETVAASPDIESRSDDHPGRGGLALVGLPGLRHRVQVVGTGEQQVRCNARRSPAVAGAPTASRACPSCTPRAARC